MSGVRAVLTDIEGTTSSISFVKDVLFPFAKRNLEAFVTAHAHEPRVRECLDGARALAGNPGLSDADTVALLRQWIDEDKKATPLKSIQGLIWEQAYTSGEVQGHVYPDAVDGLRAWHARGLRLYVYSSGSIPAQKLIFGHTAWGDLTPLFSGYFDTTTGPKVESPSYAKIAQAIGLPPEQVLFLSDSVAELHAARSAGMRTACLDRGEAVIPAGHGHPTFHGFATLDPSAL
ncbi:acireductone synthase [Pyxidicoccus parkwayensis]|uniref:Enolase-phosphatase E1 n=1 Tax=Pyxidicoccus parkwayensis TaxID=2813578 RepID=A0ABX7P058_9BACT|nr:acireductone synthase [Pyxidicoccus parkwaysis]QSQ23026.1 acireductone synthase [Pyxidicoccus parkwaysis]